VSYSKPNIFLSNQRGQSSLEYLLIVTAFFSILGIILPVASSTVDSFLSTSDDLLAKSIANELNENISLMSFLGDGSVKNFEYAPVQSISFSSTGTKLNVSTSSKNFEVETNSIQVIPKTSFEKKFLITLSKINNKIIVSFEN
jgi:uncharacterized protein (UPF0333 family)